MTDPDNEYFTSAEVIEMIKSSCAKVWNTCLLVSLVDTGRIGRATAICEYGLGADNLDGILEKFKKDRRLMMKRFANSRTSNILLKR